MRTGHYLELVKLESEDASGVFDEGSDAQGAGGRARVHGGHQVPHFDLAVVSAGNDAFRIEPDASHKFLVAFQHAQARTGLNVPQPNGVVWRTADN